MDEYFSGTRKSFSLPLKPIGTVFQQHAWQALQKIPYGKTISYAEEARLMNSPKAVRAVGNANRHNPLMIIIPCHRVVGSNGHIGGYVGGTERKEWLLRLEKGARSEAVTGCESVEHEASKNPHSQRGVRGNEN